MNPNEYDVNYSGSYRARTPNYARNHDYDRGSLSTRNDYDVDSMLSSRSQARDNPRWDRRSVADNYDRRSEVSPPPTQYSRADSPARPHAYSSYRGSEYDKPDPPMRREHSPIMKAPRTATFKGFTTPLPGNDLGYDDIGSTKRMHYVPPPEPERSYKGFTSSSLHEPSYKDQRFRYSGCRDQYPEDYPPEAGSNMRAPPRRYVPDSASVSARNHEFDGCDRSWDGGGSWCDNSYPGEQSLSPKTFKKECQRAYKEARAQRMRNLEEGLYGKCDWATFDSKYC